MSLHPPHTTGSFCIYSIRNLQGAFYPFLMNNLYVYSV